MPLRTIPLRLALVASLALAAGCTVKGSGKSAMPAWKTFVHEHPVTSAPFTMRRGAVEVRVDAVVVRESSTVVGRSSWVTVLKATLVNRGAAPLRVDDLASDFQVRTRSGEDTRGYVFAEGRAGWRHQAQTGEPTHLPAGASGEIRVQAEPNDGSRRDDPVAVSFRGEVVDLR
jgi:hypothetical protein